MESWWSDNVPGLIHEEDEANGRRCSYKLDTFINTAYGKQIHFANAMKTSTQQVTQWKQKDLSMTLIKGQWTLTSTRRILSIPDNTATNQPE